MSSSPTLLRSLLVETKDGEWGQPDPFDGSVEMAVIRGTDFEAAKKSSLERVPVRYIPYKAAGRKTLQAYDILIETAGGSKGKPTGKTTLLRPALFERSALPITCASFARFLRIDATRADPEFVYWYLQNLYLSGVIENYQVQHTGIARFQFTKFADSVEIDLPPMDEQVKVSAFLGAIENRVSLLGETNVTLETIAKALFKSWFVDFDPVRAKAEGREPEGVGAATARLFPDSFEESELGLVPSGWEIVSVADVAEVVKGKSYSSKDLVDTHHTALVTLKSFSRGGGFRIDGFKPYTGSYKSSQIVVAGDLIVAYTDVTQAAELIGKPAIVVGVEGYQTLVASLDVGVVRADASKVSRQYLYGLFCTESFQSHTFAHTTGTTVLHLAKDGVGTYKFVCPPYELLCAFSSIAETLVERQQNNIDQMRALTQLRDTLLPRLISGQLRLPEATAATEKILSEVI